MVGKLVVVVKEPVIKVGDLVLITQGPEGFIGKRGFVQAEGLSKTVEVLIYPGIKFFINMKYLKLVSDEAKPGPATS